MLPYSDRISTRMSFYKTWRQWLTAINSVMTSFFIQGSSTLKGTHMNTQHNNIACLDRGPQALIVVITACISEAKYFISLTVNTGFQYSLTPHLFQSDLLFPHI